MQNYNEQNTWEGCASICDGSGILRFYSDGVNARNINTGPNIMPNGAGLTGSSTTAQSAMIVPHPSSANQYYLFTLSPGPYVGGTTQELSYSIVDMNLAGGLGDIIPATKNTRVHGRVSEALAAVMMGDCNSFWVITKDWNSNDYTAIPVTSSGIGAGVQSTSPNYVGDSQGNDASITILKSSGDGLKLACTHFQTDVVDLMDFNPANGQMSNFMTLNMPNGSQPYGVAFSADNSRLYVTTGGPSNGQLYQYDLSSGHEATINSSRTLIFMSSIPLGDMALATDGDIYVAKSGFTSLGVISRPNLLGAACSYAATGFSMIHPGRRGLPNIVQQLSTGTCTPNPLPLDLLAFEAEAGEKAVRLFWESSNERSHSYYSVERSSNGSDFVAIGSKRARGNDLSGNFAYQFEDPEGIAGTRGLWYRLKMVDQNGNYQYSEIRYIEWEIPSPKTITAMGPNPLPAGGQLHAELNIRESGPVKVYLSDYAGHVLWEGKYVFSEGHCSVDLPAQALAKGVYLLKVLTSSGSQTERLMVL